MKWFIGKADNPAGFTIKPAPEERGWMDAYGGRPICLPVSVANQAGWVISSPVAFTVRWNGSKKKDGSLSFKFNEKADISSEVIFCKFGHGIITFDIPFLLRTESKMGVMIRGVPNFPKINCHPVEEFVELGTEAVPLAMNWKIMVPYHKVTFEKGEPICFLQPINPDTFVSTRPEIFQTGENSELDDAYERWEESSEGSGLTSWQQHYYRGKDDSGEQGSGRLKLREFTEA